MDTSNFLVELSLFALAVLFCFVPAIVAGLRNHPNQASIAVLNLPLGWTVLGWIGSLVWALYSESTRCVAPYAKPDEARLESLDLGALPAASVFSAHSAAPTTAPKPPHFKNCSGSQFGSP